MITSNIITKVYRIKCGNNAGSCFTIDYESEQYICTARHVVKEFNGNSVEIFHEKTWKTLHVKLVGHSHSGADISVFHSDVRLSEPLPLQYSSKGLVYGQDVHFLGFPYGLTSGGEDINRSFPIPFVKSGICSAMYTENEIGYFFVDSHNNKGFSGGPVVFKNSDGELAVAAVVSGYKSAYDKVMDSWGNETGFVVSFNTGIIETHDIRHAIDIIEKGIV